MTDTYILTENLLAILIVFLIDCITDIKKCDDIVVINIPYGSFLRDKKVKIDFKNGIIATSKETFC